MTLTREHGVDYEKDGAVDANVQNRDREIWDVSFRSGGQKLFSRNRKSFFTHLLTGDFEFILTFSREIGLWWKFHPVSALLELSTLSYHRCWSGVTLPTCYFFYSHPSPRSPAVYGEDECSIPRKYVFISVYIRLFPMLCGSIVPLNCHLSSLKAFLAMQVSRSSRAIFR